jgi:lysine/ornithine N-monooxygenase
VTAQDSSTVIVIGAGPFGLSAAAHLAGRGVPVRIFGDVMSSWRQHMPAGMCLKSVPLASSLSSPRPGFTLADFCASRGTQPLVGHQVVPIELFASYGQWFAQQAAPPVESAAVTRLEQTGGGFRLALDSGEELSARGVVMATGLTGMSHLPAELAALDPAGPAPDGPVSHSSQHRNLSRFAGRDVAVIGAGQSALEGAALLHEAGASVRVLARGQARFGAPPTDPAGLLKLLPAPNSPLGPSWRLYPFSHAPAAFRYLPLATRLRLVKQVLGPLGAWWLADRVVGQIPIMNGCRLVTARPDGNRVVLTMGQAGGTHTEVTADHVMAATGYRVDLARLGFLDAALRGRVRCESGWPRLTGSFESSVPGLFFIGLSAAGTFGPLMRFVCGAGFAARQVSARLAA